MPATLEVKDPATLMNDWMKGLPSGEPTKEPDGKIDPPKRSPDPEPAAKPPVSDDGKGKQPSGTEGGGAKVDGAKPADKPAPKVEELTDDDWEKVVPPKGEEKFWTKFKTNRKTESDKLKAEVKAREDKLTELQTKLAEAEKKAQASDEVSPTLKAKIDKYEADIKEMSDRLAVLDVTQHPKFQSYFGEKISDAISEAKALVGPDKAEQIEKILKQPESEYKKTQLSEFMSELESDDDRDELRAVVRDLKKVEREKEAEIKKATEHRNTLTAEQQAKSEQAKQARDTIFNQVAKSMQDPEKGFPPFQLRPEDPTWNEGVEKRLAMTKAFISGEGMKPETIVRGAFLATAFPVLLQAYTTETNKWKEEKAGLEKTISELKAAQPGAGGQPSPDNGEPGKVKLTADMDPVAVTKAWARAAREQAGG